MTIDLATLGRELKKPVEQIQSAIDLLDSGNTIPFITRFRKDQTGGLNEEQLLIIKQSVARLRALAERRNFIRKSIESQEKLTDELSRDLESAHSSRQLEDIYLPFKPKKQTLATVARQNGLEPLANDIFEGREPEKDLATRATDFVRVDKQLTSVDDVISGVGHILAERFSDNVDLRIKLRKLIKQNGKFSTQLVPLESDPKKTQTEQNQETGDHQETGAKQETVNESTSAIESESPQSNAIAESENIDSTSNDEKPIAPETVSQVDPVTEVAKQSPEARPTTPELPVDASDMDAAITSEEKASGQEVATPAEGAANQGQENEAQSNSKKKKKKKKSKKKSAPDPFAEFENFSHPVSRLPYHKTLAINRGEKSGRVKVRIQFDESEFLSEACKTLVPKDHPFAEFMESCTKDAMCRLVIPSVEREIRREVNEAAEKHAVLVFAKNLKNLLLQSPVRDFRVLAIDPGYKRGCSVTVIDRGGQVLDSSHIFVVGNEQRRTESKVKLAKLITDHAVGLIAIGNGAACRETEQLVSDLITTELKDKKVQYAMVNEAGASVYSTSEVGREELPESSPAVRSSVSIGRRLIDPLSELVKISPANIGVGLYQHDIKAKHLSETLDDVVQFCVNRVGVDVNTASPSLLRYVSGLNQLTARRLFEYRHEHGNFKNREQLKQVAGFGDATFVQSAGFLRIREGDQPLDSTAVHPENYDVALKVIESAGGSVEQLFPKVESDSQVHGVTPPTTKSESPPVATANEMAPATQSKELANNKSNEDSQSAADPDGHGGPQKANEQEQAAAESTAVEIPETTPPEHSGDVPKSDDAKTSLSEPGAEPAHSLSAPAIAPALIGGESISRPRLTQEQKNRRRELIDAIRKLDAQKLSKELNVGELLLRDIINSICQPEFDPRRGLNRPVFRSGILKIDDLKKDLCLEAQVVNVVDFGVFVDIGLGTSCLVHVSQLASYFIRDPHRFFAVGDVLKVWVTEVDAAKRRVTLTAIKPESLRQPRGNRQERKTSGRSAGKPGKFSKRKTTGKNNERRKSKRPPKPVKPITDDMLKGAEPMRSFSDLAQFFDKQSGSGKGKDNKR